MSHSQKFAEAFSHEINHLAKAHEDAQCTGYHHEQHEDLFLRGAADEAVDSVGARLQRTLG